MVLDTLSQCDNYAL